MFLIQCTARPARARRIRLDRKVAFYCEFGRAGAGYEVMYAADDERRSETAAARGRHLERHLRDGKRLQATPQPRQLRMLDASAHAVGIDQAPVRIVVGEQ